MANVIVYSAIFGGYDLPAPVIPVTGHWVLFSDRHGAEKYGWRVRLTSPGRLGPRRAARRVKVLAQCWFPQAEYSIWVDGNVQLLADPEEVVAAWLADADLATFGHLKRDCVYEEAAQCAKTGKDDVGVLERQMVRYRALGYPPHAGLAETTVVVRRHTPLVAAFEDRWWSEIEAGSVRDQVSFPVAAWAVGLRWQAVRGWVQRHQWFRYERHGGKALRDRAKWAII